MKRTCPCCGQLALADELSPMDHAPDLPACNRCRAKVAIAGHHQAPAWFDGRHPVNAKALQEKLLSDPARAAAGQPDARGSET